MAQTPPKEQLDAPAHRRGRPGVVGNDAVQAANPAFHRAGFDDPSLVLRWTEIAGPEVARLAQPLKLSGDILTLKALPGAALFLAHEKRELAARINSYLGRPAVAQIKFVQGGFAAAPRPPAPAPAPGPLPAADPAHSFAGPEKLAQALEKLGRRRVQPPRD